MAKILIVDDDPSMVALLAAVARGEGFEPVSAGDALQGSSLAIREQPALVITDMQMPAGGGRALMQRLHANARTRHIPLMVVTGTVDASHEEELRQAGASGVVFKPVDPAKFGAAIRAILGPRQS